MQIHLLFYMKNNQSNTLNDKKYIFNQVKYLI